jgi:hypothetical protein
LINWMIRMNLVAKRTNPESKKTEIVITRHGEDLYSKVPTHSLEMVFSSLKEKDRERLFKYSNILLKKTRDLLGLPCIPLSR